MSCPENSVGETFTVSRKGDSVNRENLLEWVSHPARESGRKTLLLVVFLLLVWISVYFWAGGFWTFVAIILLAGSVSPYFAVTRYKFDANGVTVYKTFYKVQKRWSQFRSYYPDRNGVLLSPFREPSRLENFRGLYVRFSGNKDEVLDYISDNIK